MWSIFTLTWLIHDAAFKAYERSDERTNSRNGYRVRQLTTRVGTLELHVPKLRHGNFSTQLFKRYQRSEQAFDLALMEMVIQGVSTRKVAEMVLVQIFLADLILVYWVPRNEGLRA